MTSNTHRSARIKPSLENGNTNTGAGKYGKTPFIQSFRCLTAKKMVVLSSICRTEYRIGSKLQDTVFSLKHYYTCMQSCVLELDAEVERISLLKTQFDDRTSKNILHSETHKVRIKLVSLYFVFCPTLTVLTWRPEQEFRGKPMLAKSKLVHFHTLAALCSSVMELSAKLIAEVLAFILLSEHAAHERPAETLAQRRDKQIRRFMDARQSIDLFVIVVNIPVTLSGANVEGILIASTSTEGDRIKI